MRFARQLGQNLHVEADADFKNAGRETREEAIVKSAPAPEPRAAAGEGKAGHEQQLEMLRRNHVGGVVSRLAQLPAGFFQLGRIGYGVKFEIDAVHAGKTKRFFCRVFPEYFQRGFDRLRGKKPDHAGAPPTRERGEARANRRGFLRDFGDRQRAQIFARGLSQTGFGEVGHAPFMPRSDVARSMLFTRVAGVRRSGSLRSRTMKGSLKLCALAGLFSSTLHAAGQAEHVVLIVWDGMRPDFVSAEQTPNLFALAQSGVTFAKHHSVYPSSTEVNGAALATGVYPNRSGIMANREYRPEIDPVKPVKRRILRRCRSRTGC